jgi:trehalose-6-phosphate synthase
MHESLSALSEVKPNEYQECKEYFKRLTLNKKFVFASIDRMHPLSGIRQKLLAFDRLLEEFPRLRRIVCMIQYVIPTDCPKSMGPGCASEMIW